MVSMQVCIENLKMQGVGAKQYFILINCKLIVLQYN